MNVAYWAPFSTVRGGASIRPQLGVKRTSPGYRRSVEIDPERTYTKLRRMDAASPRPRDIAIALG
jgi:hypothetical protein